MCDTFWFVYVDNNLSATLLDFDYIFTFRERGKLHQRQTLDLCLSEMHCCTSHTLFAFMKSPTALWLNMESLWVSQTVETYTWRILTRKIPCTCDFTLLVTWIRLSKYGTLTLHHVTLQMLIAKEALTKISQQICVFWSAMNIATLLQVDLFK